MLLNGEKMAPVRSVVESTPNVAARVKIKRECR